MAASRPPVKPRFLYRAMKARFRDQGAEIRALLRELSPGDVAVDVGANKGAYLYWMRRAVGPEGSVFAFEPQPGLARYLEAVSARMRWRNVVVRECALSDAAGQRTLHVPGWENSPGASLEQAVAASPGVAGPRGRGRHPGPPARGRGTGRAREGRRRRPRARRLPGSGTDSRAIPADPALRVRGEAPVRSFAARCLPLSRGLRLPRRLLLAGGTAAGRGVRPGRPSAAWPRSILGGARLLQQLSVRRAAYFFASGSGQTLDIT